MLAAARHSSRSSSIRGVDMPEYKAEAYSKHADILELLKEAQEAEKDQRDAAREAHLFIDKRDGQWEPYWWNRCDGKPRYTFDMTGAIVDQVAGRLMRSDFDIKVRPGDGNTSKEDATLYDGIIRAIESMSNAKQIYNAAAKKMVTGGVDGWRIVHDYVDADSFDQDLMIKPIANFLDSVWFDPGAKEQSASDAQWCVVLESIQKRKYDAKYPDGSGKSVSADRRANAYYYKSDQIIIGQIHYIVEQPRTIVMTSAGRVLEKGPELEAVMDEMAMTGEIIVDERSRPKRVVYARMFDGGGWLDEPQSTVFSFIPVIPCYANFKTFEDKILYRGVVEKLLDPQRIFNYTKSREIEEGALAPRSKYWMTPKQAAGHEKTIRTLNTNADPVQFFNYDPENPGPPQQSGGAAINPGLTAISESMRQAMGQIAGMFAASMGDNPGLQSGVAIDKLQDKGDNGTEGYVAAMEIAIAHTGKILVNSIPRVYDTQRQIQILGEDGTAEVIAVNQPMFDVQTGTYVTMNDLSRGKYSAVCTAGPSFKSKQSETVAAILEVAAIDPSIIQVAGDIMYNNLSAPGMDLVAQRIRQQLINAGMIPQSQLTEEEMAAIQQAQLEAQQNRQPDPAMVLAEAEVRKADAEIAKAQAQTQKVLVEAQKDQADITLKAQKDQREAAVSAAEIALKQEKISIERMAAEMKQSNEKISQMFQLQSQMAEAVLNQAKALNEIRQAMGADAVMSPTGVVAYEQQAQKLVQTQQETL